MNGSKVEAEQVIENADLISVEFVWSEDPVSVCLECLDSGGREATWLPIAMVILMCGTLLPVWIGLSDLETSLLMSPGHEFSMVGVLTTLSIGLAITCGLIIDRRHRQIDNIRRQVTRWDSWFESNWLGAVFIMNIVILLIVYLVVEFRIVALLVHARELSLSQGLAVSIYLILWLMTAVDIVRLFVGWRTTPVHEQINKLYCGRRWQELVSLVEETRNSNRVRKLLTRVSPVAVPLVGGIVIGGVYFGATSPDLYGRVTIVGVGVALFVVACALAWSAVALGRDTLPTSNRTTGRVSLIMGCLMLAGAWTLSVVLRLLLVGSFESTADAFNGPLPEITFFVGATLFAEWILPIVWLIFVASGASGLGPLRVLANRLAYTAVKGSKEGWSVKKKLSRLEKQARRLYRALHPGDNPQFRKCSTEGCLNYSSVQSEGDPVASSSQKTEMNPLNNAYGRGGQGRTLVGVPMGILLAGGLAVFMWLSR